MTLDKGGSSHLSRQRPSKAGRFLHEIDRENDANGPVELIPLCLGVTMTYPIHPCQQGQQGPEASAHDEIRLVVECFLMAHRDVRGSLTEKAERRDTAPRRACTRVCGVNCCQSFSRRGSSRPDLPTRRAAALPAYPANCHRPLIWRGCTSRVHSHRDFPQKWPRWAMAADLQVCTQPRHRVNGIWAARAWASSLGEEGMGGNMSENGCVCVWRWWRVLGSCDGLQFDVVTLAPPSTVCIRSHLTPRLDPHMHS